MASDLAVRGLVLLLRLFEGVTVKMCSMFKVNIMFVFFAMLEIFQSSSSFFRTDVNKNISKEIFRNYILGYWNAHDSSTTLDLSEAL